MREILICGTTGGSVRAGTGARSLLIQIQVNAEQGKKAQAVQMVRTVLGRTPPPGEQMCVGLANLSMKYGLGLEEECFSRSEQTSGVSATLAYSKAISRAVAGQSDQGLAQL